MAYKVVFNKYALLGKDDNGNVKIGNVIQGTETIYTNTQFPEIEDRINADLKTRKNPCVCEIIKLKYVTGFCLH